MGNARLDEASTSWNQIADILWIIEKASEFQKNIYFYFIDYAKTLTVFTDFLTKLKL